SLVVPRERGHKRSIAHSFAIMAGIAARSRAGGRRAATLVGAAEALLEATRTTLWTMQHRIYEEATTSACELLGEEAFEKARQEGRAMSMEESITYFLDGSPD